MATEAEPTMYVDLLAAVGAGHLTDLDLGRLVVLVRAEEVAHIRRLVEQCIDDARLGARLIQLIDLTSSHMLTTA